MIKLSAAVIILAAVGWWIVEDPCRPSNSEVTKNFAEVIAVVIGGYWAYYRFYLQREDEPAIGIELDYRCVPNANHCFLTYFDVTLTNKGKVKATAKRKPDKEGGFAFTDKGEDLKYSCSLLLRAIPQNIPKGKPICWFDREEDKKRSPLPGDIEADLIYDYEKDGEPYFWMEPAESYHVGVGFILSPGIYLAMVTFIGDKNDDEFWRRTFIIQIPEQGPVAKN
jgi:hypothetical protein